jgi:two-component system response regulator GlrR
VLTLGGTQLRFQLSTGALRRPISDRDRFGRMVGRSGAMRAVFALLEQAASSDATVLIEGETGTGKEATAEAIHRESERRDGPFIVVDCGAIPPQLLESELFGHERGSFTGAVTSRRGAFQAANGGTIFLDEIGELALDLQPKLLRALERREVKPVGATHYTPIDVRVLAATNRNLREEVTARRFRSDLYYRVAVLRVRLPPLRERHEDLGPLIEHMLETMGAAARPQAQALRTEAFMKEVLRHKWPGNVRELRNYLERCMLFEEPVPLTESQVGAPVAALGGTFSEARQRALDAFERTYLQQLLAKHAGKVSAAAPEAGVDRVYLYRLLRKHQLKAK